MSSKPRQQELSTAHALMVCLVSGIATELMFSGPLAPDTLFSSLARIALVFLSLYTIHRFAAYSLRRYRPTLKDFLFLNLIYLMTIGIMGIGRFLSSAMAAYLGGSTLRIMVSAESLHFAIPFAAGYLLIQVVLGLHFGLVLTIGTTVVMGLYPPSSDFSLYSVFVPYVLVSGLVGCLSLTRFRSRSAYLRAGINLAIISFPFALASLNSSPNISATDCVVRLFGPLVAGILASFIAAGITPLLEYLGGYVTDMRLIEMATLDHPLLKELSIQAPGTWNHSMVMGMMVETGADAIGANPILARVGAYFHDIGKIKKPLYFVENQAGGENRHDKLSPSMSALIIRSHVKDGIELGHKHKLPQVIVDMIPQHHGTSKIEYFYEKALKEAEQSEEQSEVDPSLYAYPGPKPQTREAGLLMLADGIEAAARTLSEPSLDRIQGLVQKLINKVFASGELNECELTLKDLHLIASCFTRVLTGIYHQRVTYAEPAEKVAEKSKEESHPEEEGAKELAGSGTPKKSQVQVEEKKPKRDDKEDLKRLGM